MVWLTGQAALFSKISEIKFSAQLKGAAQLFVSLMHASRRRGSGNEDIS